jgi:hypothetical protein
MFRIQNFFNREKLQRVFPPEDVVREGTSDEESNLPNGHCCAGLFDPTSSCSSRQPRNIQFQSGTGGRWFTKTAASASAWRSVRGRWFTKTAASAPAWRSVRGRWFTKTAASAPAWRSVRGRWFTKTAASAPAWRSVRGRWLTKTAASASAYL